MRRPLSLLALTLALLFPAARSASAAPARGKEPAARVAPAAEAQAAKPRAGDRADKAKPGPKPKPAGKPSAKAAPPATAKAATKANAAAKPKAKQPPAKAKRPPPKPAHSVGHPNAGRLENGVRLDISRKDIRVVPTYARDDARWGLPALVHAIERAAQQVAKRHPGSVLDVGDLSRRGGGEIQGHNSHESGRDADIGLFAVDAKGRQVHGTSFIRFGPDLRATNLPGARFDAGRTWLLVQSLLTDPHARVSHLFVAEPLRDALIAEAKRRGVSRPLLTRAQLAMMQPTGAEPHDDHLHVRISCPRADKGRCEELARDAPMGGKPPKAVASKAGKGKAGKGKAGSARAGAPRAPKKAAAQPRPRTSEEATRPGITLARTAHHQPEEQEREAPAPRKRGQVPMILDAIDLAILHPLGLSPGAADPETDADGTEGQDARDVVDESGAPKITD